MGSLTGSELEHVMHDWRFWARPAQLPPDGDWRRWLILAGRGFGKTRTGSEWVRSIACGDTPLSGGQCRSIAIIAETAKDARQVIAEGPSGILASHPKDFRPKYTEKGGFTWPNGARGLIYNATEPDQLRGPNFDAAWCDELAKWRYAQKTWDMLQFGLRIGAHPRLVITTTPRPIDLLKGIMAAPKTVITRGKMQDNAANLSAEFLQDMKALYEGTRLGRQELDAEILDDIPGALWTRAAIDAKRLMGDKKPPAMQRVVVAVDPAAKASSEKDGTSETGIVVAGLGEDGRGYVLDDQSNRLSPIGWARKAIAAYDLYSADAIVVEVNQGGEMVKTVLRAERAGLPVREVRASRGKTTRAEPIAALYEQGRVSHAGAFPALEDQMVLFTPFGIEGDGMADRVDALVWALSDLFPRMIAKKDGIDWADLGGAPAPGGWLR